MLPKNSRKFQKAFPYICDDCREFAYMKLEFCENCYSRNSIRECIKEDYIKDYLKTQEKEGERKTTMSEEHFKNLKVLAILFTFSLFFFITTFLFLVDNILSQRFPDMHPAFNSDEIEAFINAVQPIGYVCLIVIVFLIILGFLIKREKISVSSSFFLFLPTFGSFAGAMFFLAGIGVLQVIWLPLETPYYNFLTLGAFVFIPIFLLFFLFYSPYLSLIVFPILWILPWLLMILGLYIFTSGVISWFYGKDQKRDIIDFSVYKYSRHPQYLGFLIWSYGFFAHYMTLEFILVPLGRIGLGASLPWVIFALLIVYVAFLEDIKLSKKYPEKYREYRKKTPFLIKIPKPLKLIFSYPLRTILRKNFPETRKDVFKVVVFYGLLIILSSLLVNLLLSALFH